MVISASRRTDIPALYGDWLINRFKEGYVYVRNPYFPSQIKYVSLKNSDVDVIVFWTKNPENFLDKLKYLDDNNYKYYFQFTLTPYDKTIEKNIDDKEKLIEIFKRLSDMIGKEKVIWRYDPIILTKMIDINYHIKKFKYYASNISDYTNKCIISFVDVYKKFSYKNVDIKEISFADKLILSKAFKEIAVLYNLKLNICSEEDDFEIEKASCIDKYLIEKIIGKELKLEKAAGQRKLCNCFKSIDIGEYDTCMHDCIYCYANRNKNVIDNNIKNHYQHSSLLIGNIEK